MCDQAVPVPTRAALPFDIDGGNPMRMWRPARDAREQPIRSRKLRMSLSIDDEFLLEEKRARQPPRAEQPDKFFLKKPPYFRGGKNISVPGNTVFRNGRRFRIKQNPAA